MKFLEKTWVKVLCFILIPVLLLLIVASVVYLEYASYSEEYLTAPTFEDTRYFCERYAGIIENIEADYAAGYMNYSKGINYYAYSSDGTEYTNYQSTEELVHNKSGYYFNIVNGKVDTNLKIAAGNILRIEENAGDITLYSKPAKTSLSQGDVYIEYVLFNLAKIFKSTPLYVLPVLVLLLIAAIVILTISIGHKKGVQGINVTRVDSLPFECIIALNFVCGAFGLILAKNVAMGTSTALENILAVLVCVVAYLIYFAILAFTFTIVVKQVKTKKFIKSTLVYKIIYGAYNGLIKNLSTNVKVITSMLCIMIFGALFILSKQEVFILLYAIMWIATICFVVKNINDFKEITKYTEKIYNGNVEEKLDDTKYIADMKKQARYLNDIAGGFSNAVSEKLKSERLKTDLITNVSHDLKTPLTSIINYVDLLKAEDIKSEKVKEYIEVLDNKSSRLKKLTEDLVEASKASSGVIKLNMEKICLDELVTQIIGEFEDKFNAKKLEVICEVPSEKTYIMADTRHIYRVFENLFENVSKYALENSRVYIDIANTNNRAIISIKNISKYKLNISEEELMERFTRGDKSRSTEGSGLGVAIAKSLTSLQGGEFSLKIDGDLFKVEISFNAEC